jgi:5-methylthioribose kinase
MDDEVLPYLRERLPDFGPAGAPERLPEGNLNRVWRVRGEARSVIVKHAPPYIAVNPEVPLDPARLQIEAECLRALGPKGELAEVGTGAVRPPRPLVMDPDHDVLVMEDLGTSPTLGRWLRTSAPEAVQARAPELGASLGRLIGRLHAATRDTPAYADRFANRPMQETRHAVQYQGVTDMLVRADVDAAPALGARAEALGEQLLDPGRCLTMGDLWPSSVLVGEDAAYLIDWELAHYGRPLQDVAHFLAHLWMQAHRAPSEAVAAAVQALRTAFIEAYTEALEGIDTTLWTDRERRDAALHLSAEILVRAVGPFQEGSLYEGLPPDHPAVQQAVRVAARHLRKPAAHDPLSD